jgi:hypothetical protein
MADRVDGPGPGCGAGAVAALLSPCIPVAVLFSRQWDDRSCDFYISGFDMIKLLVVGVPLLVGVGAAAFSAVSALTRRRGVGRGSPTVWGLVAVGAVVLAATLFAAFLDSPLPESYPPELRQDLRPGCSLSELG